MLLIFFNSILVFIFGCCLGSFLNVVIFRLEKDQSFLKGRSYCPQCKHLLRVKDLVPLLSFFFQRGKCRYCQRKISWQYPLVEFFTGLLFCLFFLKYYFLKQFLYLDKDLIFFIRDLILVCFLMVIFVYDLKYLLVIDKLVFTAIIFAVISSLILKQPKPQDALLASFCLGSFFFLQYFFSKGKWLGAGDIEIGILIGFILGFSKMILVVFLAYVIGAIIGLILIFQKKRP